MLCRQKQAPINTVTNNHTRKQLEAEHEENIWCDLDAKQTLHKQKVKSVQTDITMQWLWAD